MKFNPHEYQAAAIAFIEAHPMSALFLDMGLGKTVITLSAIYSLILDSFSVSRVLVVAPLRVARDTWPAELEKWDHLRGLTCAVAVGSAKERVEALKKDAMITVINRENIPWLVENFPWRWDMLVIDELSSFKSLSAKRFRALLKRREHLVRIVGLTGTPAPNGLMDLWAEFRLLDGGLRLGKAFSLFRLKHFLPARCGYDGTVYEWAPQPDAEERIFGKISDITMSMSAVDYLQMPERIETEYRVSMTDAERRTYKEIKERVSSDFLDLTTLSASSVAGKLCQMAGGAVYVPAEGAEEVKAFHSHKLDALEDLVEAACGQPLLVAYWYRHDRSRILERFPDARPLDSSEDFRDWNAGRIPLALIHPASAGHGLNLQEGGSVMVWFSLTWSLELYQQACARLWRQGQKSKTVRIIRIITTGTIDEAIIGALRSKDMAQDRLLEAVKKELAA